MVMHLPHTRNSYSFELWKNEIKELIKKLEEKFNVEITEEKLKDAIKLCNEERNVMKEFFSLILSYYCYMILFFMILSSLVSRNRLLCRGSPTRCVCRTYSKGSHILQRLRNRALWLLLCCRGRRHRCWHSKRSPGCVHQWR